MAFGQPSLFPGPSFRRLTKPGTGRTIFPAPARMGQIGDAGQRRSPKINLNCMNKFNRLIHGTIAAGAALLIVNGSPAAESSPPKDPRFSVKYMDPSIEPSTDFYHYACGTWIKEN